MEDPIDRAAEAAEAGTAAADMDAADAAEEDAVPAVAVIGVRAAAVAIAEATLRILKLPTHQSGPSSPLFLCIDSE